MVYESSSEKTILVIISLILMFLSLVINRSTAVREKWDRETIQISHNSNVGSLVLRFEQPNLDR